MTGTPRQGDIVWADPDPTRGSEQAEARPFVIVSVDQLNRSPLGLSLAVPLTRTDFSNALHLEIALPEGGLRERSFAMPEQLRVLAHERVTGRLGGLRGATLTELLRRCRLLLREAGPVDAHPSGATAPPPAEIGRDGRQGRRAVRYHAAPPRRRSSPT